MYLLHVHVRAVNRELFPCISISATYMASDNPTVLLQYAHAHRLMCVLVAVKANVQSNMQCLVLLHIGYAFCGTLVY